jgi:hypothetical protein
MKPVIMEAIKIEVDVVEPEEAEMVEMKIQMILTMVIRYGYDLYCWFLVNFAIRWNW